MEMEITPDEKRLLEQMRAEAAIATRPPDSKEAILRLLRIIRDAAIAGRAIDSTDPLWNTILASTPDVVLGD